MSRGTFPAGLDRIELAALRDEALYMSGDIDYRYSLGPLVVGRAMARWESATGGESALEYEIMEWDGKPFFIDHPTVLYTRVKATLPHKKTGEPLKASAVTTYLMDLGRRPEMLVHHNLFTGPWRGEKPPHVNRLNARREKQGEATAHPTDIGVLFDELRRGAYGSFRLTSF